MGISDREYYKEKHLPDCNCTECREKRLYETNGGDVNYHLPDTEHPFGEPIINLKTSNITEEKACGKMEKCPSCRMETLTWNEVTDLYECSNVGCNLRLPLFLKKGLDR